MTPSPMNAALTMPSSKNWRLDRRLGARWKLGRLVVLPGRARACAALEFLAGGFHVLGQLFAQGVEFGVGEFFGLDEAVVGAFHGVDQLVELGLKGLAVAVLAVL